MKKFIYYPAVFALIAISALTSCKKDSATPSAITTKSGSTSSSVDATTTISLGVVATNGTKDTLYLVNCKSKNSKKDSVAASALPSAIGTYLTANYSGYTFNRAFKITDSTGVVVNYIVVIKYNGNFVGLKFSATGDFVSVLEQMAGADMPHGNGPVPPPPGPGFHPGGPFDDRGAPGKDTIALSALPSAVTAAFNAKYGTDTLLHAQVTPDTAYVLISKNNGMFTTVISKTGTILQRVAMPKPDCDRKDVAQSALPTAVTTYLTTTYPGYVFDKAFAISKKGTLQGYDVFITQNSTHYAVSFDASGKFLKAVTLH